MSIPLDRLYHYIESVAQEITSDNVIIYRFFPHGSKKIEDLNMLNKLQNPNDGLTKIQLICHDQEPLNYDLYSHYVRGGPTFNQHQSDPLTKSDLDFFKLNLRDSPHNIYDKCLLLHSELNSTETEKYANDCFIPVYYWNHAVLAQDWYRYAHHIKQFHTNKTNKFLVYNRAWTGTREYRLKLADLLIEYQLIDQCQTSCSFVDHDTNTHYSQHKFTNPDWQPIHKLEDYYKVNDYPAHFSADFELSDYQSTDIELVLETLFDDARIHLTEKSLRPIALGQPFILTGPTGSLKYLKKYGFKTYDSVIDESYDDIVDPQQRLVAIVKLMSDIAKLSPTQYQELIFKMNKIAEYNKNYFFSNTFINTVTNELIDNLCAGVDQLLTTNTYERFLAFRSTIKNNKDYMEWRTANVPQQHFQEYDQIYQKILNLKHQ
jgi:hypothetical protein